MLAKTQIVSKDLPNGKKNYCYIRVGRVDGDDVFNTAPSTKNTDTTVTIVTL